MIGKKVLFIRTTYPPGSTPKNKESTGIIRDKFVSSEYNEREKKTLTADCYLVELENGTLTKFFCDEAVQIINEQNQIPEMKFKELSGTGGFSC